MLAQTGLERAPTLPDIPTMNEAALPGYYVNSEIMAVLHSTQPREFGEGYLSLPRTSYKRSGPVARIDSVSENSFEYHLLNGIATGTTMPHNTSAPESGG